MRFLISSLTLTSLAVFAAGCSAPNDSASSGSESTGRANPSGMPPRTDYCEMLQRDIQGQHYGFMGGNKVYYIAGSFGAYWDEYWESETLGFTHPMFRDGRARGNAIVESDVGGDGHDSWGWEFWRKTRSAYGTLIVDGQEHKHPEPKTLDWRPDKMVAHYEVNGVQIREDKFISRDDVLTSVIVSDQDIEIRFEGESFWDDSKVPTFDGDTIEGSFSRTCESEITFDASTNAMRLVEGGTAVVKPLYGEPATVGRMMYDGLSFVYSSSVPMQDVKWSEQDKGNLGYSFVLKIPAGQPVSLSLAIADDYGDALTRSEQNNAAPEVAMSAKTVWFNDLLNEQIPYFRCSDEMSVKTYYYLWALNFMYFRDIGEGWLKYPHTQTAVNNFMGLHLWDSWAYIQAGSWVADKWQWGHGNALSWQYMVPFKNKGNNMPDNFGKGWYSPLVRMVFVGATEPAWQQYRRSGDKRYLEEAYNKVFKPLYWDGKGPTRSFGTEINAIDTLSSMATALGENADVHHWQAFRPERVKQFESGWSGRWDGFYGERGVPWKDIWALSALQSVAMPKEWGEQMVEEYVLDTDKGFASPVGVNTRAADSPPNGIFRCSTISTWLAIDGMFRQDQAYAGILTTLNHTKAMHREWGYPVAPEAWEENHLAWGSRYYNWDLAHVLPIIEWLAGLDYSIPDQQFTFAPHLPSTWDFIETYTPVVIDDETKWVHARVDRTQTEDAVQLVASVSGNPLMETIVAPYTEDRAVLETTGEGEESTLANAVQFRAAQGTNTVKLVLGEKLKTYKTLVWSTPRTRIFHGSVTVDVENLLPGTVLRYTTDGSEPTDTSPLWEGQVQVTSTTSFKLRAYSENGSTYEPYEMVYEATELKPADTDPTNTKPGMFYRYYELEGKHTSLPDFESLQPTKTGTLTPDQFNQHINVEAIAGDRRESYALHLTSYLSVPVDEVYHFHLHADDGARLVIDGQTVVDLNTHSYVDAWEAEGSVGLQEGLHRVDLFYYQDRHRTRLTVKSRKGNEASYEYISPESWQISTR
ncbi:MAG: chitobiase/beta-hexosaminidase C-terminal domain-containing protein [Verrucomicrobia bacterium]|nr:chitobiase/beta-hexosaminidase C-terminal domain-containing protein [Verrucomicrobiota bacterium]